MGTTLPLWGDLLTNYDGTAISYDHIGNPTNWLGISSLTWSGRTLDRAVLQSEHYIDYTYNSDGIRTKKYEYNGNDMYSYTHNYVLDGSKILKETILYSSAFNGNSTTTLEYYYDESGIASFRYNGTVYHYIKNLQGDVIGIVNSNNGGIVVEYTYDAWGNILSITGELASTVGQINPYRYRGYYYDSDTGLYYLNSRYYDPQVGRFINADGIVGANGGLQGYNMFAYCNNNPVAFVDPTGECMLGDGHYQVEFAAHDLEVGDICTFCGKKVDAVFFNQPVLWTRICLANPDLSGKEISAKVMCIVESNERRDDLTVRPSATKTLCFVAGTLIKAENGDVAIEDIEVGDYVWAHNPETGETALKRVVQTFVNETDTLVEIVIGNEIIKATLEHPFYVVGCNDIRIDEVGFGIGWVKAKDLGVGDTLRLLSGETVIVESVTITYLDTPVKVYNFEVEDFHTYFVGKDGWLVHNNNCTSVNQLQIQVERGQAPSTVSCVHKPHRQGGKPHIHFTDGSAMNLDGTPHDKMHGIHRYTNAESDWLSGNGW